MNELAERMKALFETRYDLGKVVAIEQFTVGAHNKSFGIVAEKDGIQKEWFGRRYVPKKEEQEIVYEHALLQYIKERDPQLVAAPMENREGKTFFRAEGEDQKPYYYAVFEYLKGDENEYSWIYNRIPDKMFLSAAKGTARYHCSSYGFVPPEGSGRIAEDTFPFMRTWYDFMTSALEEMRSDRRTKLYTDYMLTQMDLFGEEVQRVLEMERRMDQLPRTTIHQDIQISNFKYTDDEVTGIFDFDWAMEGERLYDVAYATKSFCSAPWDWDIIGETDLTKVARFLQAYNDEMKRRSCPLGGLCEAEMEMLPLMIQAGCLRVVYDFVDEFYHDRSLNVFQYFVYANRYCKSMKFLRDHHEDLVRIAASLR